jgi:hypothetical protein
MDSAVDPKGWGDKNLIAYVNLFARDRSFSLEVFNENVKFSSNPFARGRTPRVA